MLSLSMCHLSLLSLVVILCLNSLVQPVIGVSHLANITALSNTTTLNDALGINCRGSYLCPSRDLANDYIRIMLSIVDGLATCHQIPDFDCGPLKDDDVYEPNAHIVCLPLGKGFLGGICAFTQGNVAPWGLSGVAVKRKLEQLSAHGCQTCGSVPLDDDNDPAKAGILTVNYISGLACPGLCPPTHYYDDQPATS